MGSRVVVSQLGHLPLLGVLQPADTVLRCMEVNKWSVLVWLADTMAKPACFQSPHLKPEMKSLDVGTPSDHRPCMRSHRGARLGLWVFSNGLRVASAAARLDVSGAPEAKTIGFSANPQGCINLALDLALFLKLFIQDCS